MKTSLGTHNVNVEEWVGEPGLLSVIRGAFDPAAVPSARTAVAAAPPSDLPATKETGNLHGHGPMAVEEHWTYLQTDSLSQNAAEFDKQALPDVPR